MTGVTAQADLTYPLAGLLAEPAGSRRDYAFAGIRLELGEDLRLAAPVAGRFRASRTNRGVLISGRFDAGLALTCSRCLRPIDLPLEIALNEEVLPIIDFVSGKPLDATIEPEIARLTDHHELDLEPLLREAIQLAEPIAPVCRPDCPGLCVVCGEPLDDGPHAHADDLVDPRLDVLRAFRVDGDAETG